MRKSNLALRPPDESFFAWLPPDATPIPEWVEKHVNLTRKSSSSPGPLRISKTPYTRDILLALKDPFVDHIVMCFGRQVAKTEGCQIPYLCYLIANDPGPTTFLLPTQKKGEEVEAQKIDPMLCACKPVQDQRTGNRDDWTRLSKKMRDMILFIAWAGSGSEMTGRSNRYLLRDEIDEYEAEVGPDGTNPMKAIEETTRTFSNRKILDTSTPSNVHGNIWQGLISCRYVFEFYIPCPSCHVKQILYWGDQKSAGGMKWLDLPSIQEKAASAWYECQYCETKVTNLQKIRALQDGEWRAKLTPDPCEQILREIPASIKETITLQEVLDKHLAEKIGFHLPQWYSPFALSSINHAVKEFLEAIKAFEEGENFTFLRDWRKYWAARPWEEKKVVESDIKLLENVIDIPPMEVPENAVCLTCGIDPSEGGYFFTVKAWVPNREHRGFSGHLVHYGKLPNLIAMEEFLTATTYPVYKSAEKRKRILLSALDTGGSEYEGEDVTMTAEAYAWLKQIGAKGLRVIGTKGASHSLKGSRARAVKIEKMPGKGGEPIPGGLMLWEIDTDAMKQAMWFHLGIEKDKPGRFTFHNGITLENQGYINHLRSEERQRNKKGKLEWVRKGKNHWLDATLLADILVENDVFGLQLMNLGSRSASSGRRVISRGVE